MPTKENPLRPIALVPSALLTFSHLPLKFHYHSSIWYPKTKYLKTKRTK